MSLVNVHTFILTLFVFIGALIAVYPIEKEEFKDLSTKGRLSCISGLFVFTYIIISVAVYGADKEGAAQAVSIGNVFWCAVSFLIIFVVSTLLTKNDKGSACDEETRSCDKGQDIPYQTKTGPSNAKVSDVGPLPERTDMEGQNKTFI